LPDQVASETYGRALLLEGLPATASSSLADVGAALRAGAAPWSVRRLSCVAARDHRLDDRSLRDELDALAGDLVACVLVVLAGSVVREHGELRLVIAHRQAGAADSLPLAEIGKALRSARAAQCIAVAAVSAPPGIDSAEIAAPLATPAGSVIVTITAPPQDVIDTLVAALRGAARDGRCGAITGASLAAYVSASHAAAVCLPPGDHRDLPWFEPPSLELLWQLGWSTGATAQPPAELPLATEDPLVGAILPGRFRIDAPIATGSFGRVYRARQLAVDRDVAVKVIRAGVDPFSEDGRLFVHEIQAVARIDHRNVVRVHQADVTADGRLFFAMELLAGRDLQELAGAGTFEPARAVALVQQLLAALEAAHHAGLVHADVKPGNAIVIDGRGGERLVLVDFGLSRLRRHDADTLSVGGTPAFMAPEQLRAGRVDARSDQFAAALVLVALLGGWRRRRASELAPPPEVLATIAAPVVRAAVTRALSISADDRFPSVAAFAAALAGSPTPAGPPPARPPFHGLAAFTEDDREQLHGRDRELAQLTELVFYRRLVVVTAPSGVGKTSLLRAGLVPRLGALGTDARYASCRTDDEATIAGMIAPGVATLATALAGRPAAHPVAVIIDQVEAALEAAAGSPASALLDAAIAGTAGRAAGAHFVLSVREDFLARLLDRLPDRGDAGPIVRIGPLELEGARDAIVRPLAERRLAVEPELLDRLLEDLTAAGARLGAELGWAVARPVYPPHLQLACSVLHDRLPAGVATLSLAHYRGLGGFDAIVGEHLERVLDDLAIADAQLARELFLALVTSTQLREASDVATLVVRGPPGIGKTRLVLEAFERAEMQARVHVAEDADAGERGA
jgi:serine/threonine-protein kinase